MLSNTALFSFKSRSNYYMRITFSGRYWTTSTSCEVSGGFSNSYGTKVSCVWEDTNTIVVSQFDAIDYNSNLARYRIKVMFRTTSYNTGVLYSVSASIDLYANYDAYISNRDTIFTLSTSTRTRRISRYISGSASGVATGDTASILTVNSVVSTASTLSISMTLTPSYTYSIDNDERFIFWTFAYHNFNLPLSWTSFSAVLTFSNGNTYSVASCITWLSVN
jgi:hypothetical protein